MFCWSKTGVFKVCGPLLRLNQDNYIMPNYPLARAVSGVPMDVQTTSVSLCYFDTEEKKEFKWASFSWFLFSDFKADSWMFIHGWHQRYPRKVQDKLNLKICISCLCGVCQSFWILEMLFCPVFASLHREIHHGRGDFYTNSNRNMSQNTTHLQYVLS